MSVTKLLALAVLLALLVSPTVAQESPHVQSTVDGTARDILPSESTGMLAVIAQGEPDDNGVLHFVLRNDSADTATWLKAVVTVRDRAGNTIRVIDADAASRIQPYVINPGDIAIGYVVIGNIFNYVPDPEGTTYQIDLAPIEEMIERSYRDFDVHSFEGDADGIEGKISTSIQDESGSGSFIAFQVACFDNEGNATGGWLSTAEIEVRPGEDIKVKTEPDNGTDACDRFLVTAGDL